MLSGNLLQLNNLELAVNLAKRGNLPGAENLVSVNSIEILIGKYEYDCGVGIVYCYKLVIDYIFFGAV